jgi:tetratricopeptide (TPR) repeat protein
MSGGGLTIFWPPRSFCSQGAAEGSNIPDSGIFLARPLLRPGGDVVAFRFQTGAEMIASRLVRFSCAVAVIALVAGCSGSSTSKEEFLENGNKFFAEEKYAEAIVEYRNAVQQDEKFGAARWKLAQAYEKSGNPGAAFREFIRAADLLPENAEVQIQAAAYLMLAGQFEDAKTRVQRVLDRDPKNVAAQVLLGNSLAGLRDIEGGIKELEEAIALDPARSQTYSNLAMLRLAQGQKEQAKAAFLKAVEIDPKSVAALLALANYHMSSGENADAESVLKRALAIEPSNVLANRALAAFFSSTGRTAEAEAPMKVLAASSSAPELKIALADYYLSNNRLDEATRVLQPLAQQKPPSSAAEARLAAIAYNTDKPRGHQMIDALLMREEQNVEALLLKSRWLLAEGKAPEALQRAQAATKADATSAPAHYQVGTILMTQRRNAEAITSLNEVIRLNPRAAGAQVLLSRLLLAQGSAESALQMAEGAVANVPTSPEARATLVRSLIARDNLSRAEGEVAALLKEYPKSSTAHALNGALQVQKKDAAAARRAFELAAQLSPNSLEALVGLTRIDLRQNRIADAKRRVEARLAAEPNRAELLFLAAGVNAAEQDMPTAEQRLRKAIELQPAYAPSYSLLAGVLVAQKKLDDARQEFDKMVERDPKNTGARTMAAMIVHSQQNLGDAKKRYEDILAANPRSTVAANNLAWMYAEEGVKLDEALRLAQMAAAELAQNAAAQDTLGWVYYKRELPALAIPAFEKSAELDPMNPLYQYHLALALQKSGDSVRARGAVQRALKLKPDYTEAQQLLASL